MPGLRAVPATVVVAVVTEEEWRQVPALRAFGIPRGYEASSEGRVRSVDRTLRDGRRAGGVVLSPWPDKDGYLTVRLGRRNQHVHVLVCLAFHGAPQVRHLSGNRQVNKPAELAWGSIEEQERDKRKHKKERGVGTPPGTIRTDLGQ